MVLVMTDIQDHGTAGFKPAIEKIACDHPLPRNPASKREGSLVPAVTDGAVAGKGRAGIA